MPFEKYLSPSRVVELTSETRDGAFAELVDAICATTSGLDRDTVFDAIAERERLMSTRIGRSIAVPHARIAGLAHPTVAFGRSREGVVYEVQTEDRIHIIAMILATDEQHLDTLSGVVARLAAPGVVEQLLDAPDTETLYEILVAGAPERKATRMTADPAATSLLLTAERLAQAVGSKTLFVHTDQATRELARIAENMDVFVFTDQPLDGASDHIEEISFPFRSIGTESRLELSLLVARVAGHTLPKTPVVSVLASGTRERLDRLAVTESSGRFGELLDGNMPDIGSKADHRVFARVLQLAAALAAEGREGKPVGTIFVLGDTERVIEHCQQLIANPFKGYEDVEKNVLDPSMEESIKEFAKIDGAFVVEHDGTIRSAGTYLRTSNVEIGLPQGLGSRHMAAASITVLTDALAIAISESTRTVSLFRSGKRIAELRSATS